MGFIEGFVNSPLNNFEVNLVFIVAFLFNSPHDISQSMRKRKNEFAHDVIAELLKALLHKFPMHKAADVIACFSL